jgi:putative oxygen-independent coproporphyrinogen III oxidase
MTSTDGISPPATRVVAMRSILLYVHIPFCPSKCHFCYWVKDIPTRELRLDDTAPLRKAYIEALKQQITHYAAVLADRGYAPKLMYWGGGTPGVLSPDELSDIMETMAAQLDLSGITEATLESTPDVMTEEKLRAYRQAGFDRISFGVQTFDDQRLGEFGRAHSSEQARRAVHMAAEAGFPEINVDLMCGMPGEGLDETAASVETAVGLPITHVSLYPYRPVEGTVMHRQLGRGRSQVDRSERKASYGLARKMLIEAGFPEYRVSYFGKRPCSADLAYYRLEMDWMGFGAGANSLLNHRYLVTNPSISAYAADPTTFDTDTPASSRSVAANLLRLGLECFEGVDAGLWHERVGVPLDEIVSEDWMQPRIEHLRRTGGLTVDENGMRLNPDQVADAFIDFGWHATPESGRR